METESLLDQIENFGIKMSNLRDMTKLLSNMIYSESDEIDFLEASRSLSDTVAELAELRYNEIGSICKRYMTFCRKGGTDNGFSV